MICFLHLTQMHPILVSLTPIWIADLRYRRSAIYVLMTNMQAMDKTSPCMFDQTKTSLYIDVIIHNLNFFKLDYALISLFFELDIDKNGFVM